MQAIEEAEKALERFGITVLVTCFYVGLTAMSTSHQMLLLESPVILLPLNAGAPLKGFFLMAPFIVVALHFHLMIQQHALLCRRRGVRANISKDGDKWMLFQVMPLLRHVQDDAWLRTHVWYWWTATRVVLPVLAVCVVQYQFLPYHSFWITFWHQSLVVVDLMLVWYFLLAHGGMTIKRGKWLAPWGLVTLVFTLIVLFYSFILAVVPGTWIEAWTGEHALAGLVPRNLVFRLKAEGVTLVDRDLRYANLEGATLIRADFRGAKLTGAILDGIDLRNANLAPLGARAPIFTQERGVQKTKAIEEEIRRGAFKPTRLNGASLKNADMGGANLILVDLTQADLRRARLMGVELTGAWLTRAQLQEVDLAAAELSMARMEGADLTGAHAEGATFDHASLSGASLNQVNAPAASFVSANLEGARLTEAVLKAANFYGAALTGSDLRMASLQGSSSLRLDATDLRGAYLGGICGTSVLGLTDFRFVNLDFLSAEEWGALRSEVAGKQRGRPKEQVEAVLDRIDEGARRVNATQAQMACLGTLLSSSTAQRNLGRLRLDEEQNAIVAYESEANTWNEAAFHKELAKELLERACLSEGLGLNVVSRAAGEYGPGDLELDLELAKQLLVKIRDPNCRELKEIPPRLKQQIAWRLRKHAHAEEERH